MLFIILTVIGLLAVLSRLSYIRFQAVGAAERKNPEPFSAKAYWTWLRSRAKAILTRESYKKAEKIFVDWTASHYPGWMKWIFLAFGLSVLYLAASGFFFALFIPRGMFGLPLLGHIILGGLFAFSLTALLAWRGRAYRLDKDEATVFESFACPVFKNLSKTLLRKVLFWAFAAFGLVQVSTALGSMLPIFTFETQQAFIAIHRTSALALLLTAIVFIDVTFIPQRRP